MSSHCRAWGRGGGLCGCSESAPCPPSFTVTTSCLLPTPSSADPTPSSSSPAHAPWRHPFQCTQEAPRVMAADEGGCPLRMRPEGHERWGIRPIPVGPQRTTGARGKSPMSWPGAEVRALWFWAPRCSALPEVRGRFKPVSQQPPPTPQYILSCDAPSVVTGFSPDGVGGAHGGSFVKGKRPPFHKREFPKYIVLAGPGPPAPASAVQVQRHL